MTDAPPTLDPVALDRWHRHAPDAAPWLHEEVARRMLERLQWFRQTPRRWTHWEPVRGGQQAQAALVQTCGKDCHLVERQPQRQALARRLWQPAWWQPRRWQGKGPRVGEPTPGTQDMVWANMGLHLEVQPQALLSHWHDLLCTHGFLMFSCLGPDSLRELRGLYQALGWPPAGPDFTDMHDWGDMLVGVGFAEPVMDMERLTLTFATPERLLQELAGLGRNVHPGRFAGLRGRHWREHLLAAIDAHLPRDAQGRLCLSFELIYGHALKPPPRIKAAAVSSVSLSDMRGMLQGGTPRRAA